MKLFLHHLESRRRPFDKFMIKSTFIPFASRPGQSNSVQQGSDNPVLDCPIVLLHGWGCDSRIWESLIPFLNAYADLILVDIEYADKNSDECCKEIEKVLPDSSVLLGWSLGGMLATRLAAMYPTKVNALISLASNASFVANDGWANAMLPETFMVFFGLFVSNSQKALTRFSLLQVKGDSDSSQQLSYLKKCLVNNASLKTGLDYLREMNNRDILLHEIICPSLYVFGESDTLVPVSAAYELQKLIHQPSKAHQNVAVIRGKGHVLPCANDDGELLVVFNDFFKKLKRSR